MMGISEKTLILFFFMMIFMEGCPNSSEGTSSDEASVPTYTVDFDHAGASSDTPVVQSLKRGKTITKPSDPTKTGFVFAGWYTCRNHLQRHNFSDPITQNITLYAKWNLQSKQNLPDTQTRQSDLGDQPSANSEHSTLVFELVADNSGYSVKKKEGATITGELIIPERWNGKPVTEISDNAFSNLTGPTIITIPNSVTSIGREAFRSCTGLTNITLPDSLKSIGEIAFYHCTSLTNITLPASLTSIGRGAFTSCTGLRSVTVSRSTPPSSGDGMFNNCPNLQQIKVPRGSVDAYQSASGWKYYKKEISANDKD